MALLLLPPPPPVLLALSPLPLVGIPLPLIMFPSVILPNAAIAAIETEGAAILPNVADEEIAGEVGEGVKREGVAMERREEEGIGEGERDDVVREMANSTAYNGLIPHLFIAPVKSHIYK